MVLVKENVTLVPKSGIKTNSKYRAGYHFRHLHPRHKKGKLGTEDQLMKVDETGSAHLNLFVARRSKDL